MGHVIFIACKILIAGSKPLSECEHGRGKSDNFFKKSIYSFMESHVIEDEFCITQKYTNQILLPSPVFGRMHYLSY